MSCARPSQFLWATPLSCVGTLYPKAWGGRCRPALHAYTSPSSRRASGILARGIRTVDSFDIHANISLRRTLGGVLRQHGTVSVIASGWDPGSDSVVRTLIELSYHGDHVYNHGHGDGMGHAVVVKAIAGVKRALSMTIPTGTGIHRRMVYIELKRAASPRRHRCDQGRRILRSR